MNRFWSGAILTIAISLPSCSVIRRGGRAPVAPPVIAAPPTQPPKPVETPQVPPPPKVEQTTATPPVAPKVATQIPAKPPPPVKTKPPKVRRAAAAPKPAIPPAPVAAGPQQQPAAPANVAAAPSGSSDAAPPPATESVPVLAPMLSPTQQEAFNRAIDAAVASAESGLASVASKQLNAMQQQNADRARSFILQAQQVRTSDLVTAKSFADRAALLARALVEELR